MAVEIDSERSIGVLYQPLDVVVRDELRRRSVSGELAPGTPVVTLQSLDPIFVDFTLPQQQLAQISVGQKVGVGVELHDADLAVHGTQGVHVADGSAVPGPLGVNPQITIMALATRLATHLATHEEVPACRS